MMIKTSHLIKSTKKTKYKSKKFISCTEKFCRLRKIHNIRAVRMKVYGLHDTVSRSAIFAVTRRMSAAFAATVGNYFDFQVALPKIKRLKTSYLSWSFSIKWYLALNATNWA